MNIESLIDLSKRLVANLEIDICGTSRLKEHLWFSIPITKTASPQRNLTVELSR